ncbi:MAG: hypothetical protein AAGF11_24590 [Myxococcota bacterium]
MQRKDANIRTIYVEPQGRCSGRVVAKPVRRSWKWVGPGLLAILAGGAGCSRASVPELSEWLFSRCSKTIPEGLLQREDYSDFVVVGSLIDSSEFSLEEKAVELAFRQVRGLDDELAQRLAYVHCNTVDDEEEKDYDGLSRDEANIEMARFLADDLKVPVIVGASTSIRTEAAYDEVVGHLNLNTLFISHSATSPELTELDGEQGLLWRTAPPDDIQGKAIALDMKGRGVTNAAIIYEQGPYGEGLTETFMINFFDDSSRDITTCKLCCSFETGSGGGGSGLSTCINDIGDSIIDAVMMQNGSEDEMKVEVLFISSEKEDIVQFLGQSATSNYSDAELFLADIGHDADIFMQTRDSAGELHNRLRGSRPSPGGCYDDKGCENGYLYDCFSDAYEGTFNVDGREPEFDPDNSGFTSYAYDAAWLAFYGTAWAHLNRGLAGEISGETVARGLRKLFPPAASSSLDSFDVGPKSWSSVLEQLGNDVVVDINGASGALDYEGDEGKEELANCIEIWEVHIEESNGDEDEQRYPVEICTFDPFVPPVEGDERYMACEWDL